MFQKLFSNRTAKPLSKKIDIRINDEEDGVFINGTKFGYHFLADLADGRSKMVGKWIKIEKPEEGSQGMWWRVASKKDIDPKEFKNEIYEHYKKAEKELKAERKESIKARRELARYFDKLRKKVAKDS